MNKILKEYPVMSTRDDSVTGRHIHFLRILAFANESISFTDKEDAHFDDCRICRLKVIHALRTLAPRAVRIIVAKAA